MASHHWQQLLAISSRVPGEPDWSKAIACPAFSVQARRQLMEKMKAFDDAMGGYYSVDADRPRFDRF